MSDVRWYVLSEKWLTWRVDAVTPKYKQKMFSKKNKNSVNKNSLFLATDTNLIRSKNSSNANERHVLH